MTKTITKASFVSRNGAATAKYKASHAIIGSSLFHPALQRGTFSYFDVEAMRRDPEISLGLYVLQAPLSRAKWAIKCKDESAAKWADATLKRFWLNDVIKAARMLEWGASGGEPMYRIDEDTELVEYVSLRDVHFFDAKPLEYKGELVGLGISKADPARLFAPRFAWWVNEQECSNLYGRPRLMGAFEPWMEQRGRKGAIDIRRGWFWKNAFSSGLLRHPAEGTLEIDGRTMSFQQYARQILEEIESGAMMALPSMFDENGKQLWEYESPKINGTGEFLIQYPKELDTEKLKGMGIMPEVIQASETGSGWSGRSVPFLVFLVGEDRIIFTILMGFKKHVLDPLMMANFGIGPDDYAIEPESLVPKDEPPQQPGQGAPNQGPPPNQPRDPQQLMGGRVQMSFDESQHPRDDGGKFISKEDIASAKTDSAKADELRARVTNPAERRKLETHLGKHGDRSQSLREKLASLHSERKQAYHEIRQEAEKAMGHVDAVAKSLNDDIGQFAFPEDYEDTPFAEFERSVLDFDQGMTVAEKFDQFKEVEREAKAALDEDQEEREADENSYAITADDIAANKKILTDAITHAREGRMSLRKYVSHRKEMKDIRSGGWKEEKQYKLSANHAPAGGMSIQGQTFKGGEFIPANVMAQATPEEKAKLASKGQKKSPRQMSEKASKAKASHHMIDGKVQRYAEEHNEPRFAKAMGGVSFPDSEAVDVVIADNRGVAAHGIELKTVVDNKNNKITMKRSAMERKWQWEKKNKATYHTVVLDDSAVFEAKGKVEGLHPKEQADKYGKAHDESKRRIFYRRGVGSFRIGGMHECKDMAELKKLLAMPDDKLPEAAQRTDGK